MRLWKALLPVVIGALIGVALGLMALAQPAHAAKRATSEIGALIALNGSPTWLGCISATTSAKNNADATAFTITKETRMLLVVPSAAARVLADTDSTEDITTTNGVPLTAGQHFVMILKDNQNYVQAITDSGSSSVCFWSLD